MARVIDEKERLEIQKQINSEPHLWHTEWTAYPPKVKIENDIFPRPHEVYNCTNCKKAEPEHPVHKMRDKENYYIKCTWNRCYNTAPRWNDINCPMFDNKTPRPKHGFMPGIESGPYDINDKH